MNKNAQARKKTFISKGEKNMALTERQKDILQSLKTYKKLSVKALADNLFVSEATIRRDLSEMQNMGLIERSHGGAILPENAEEVSIFLRMERNASEKERVATKAIFHIPPFKSVFIDSSSTALALAERIDLSHKTVVTNNLQTAIQLSKKKNVNLILLGGNVNFNTNSATGTWTARLLEDFSFDLMLSSCAAVRNSAVFETSLGQKEIKKVAFERCQKRILLVDHTKYGAYGTYRLANLSQYDFVVTDFTPPDADNSDIHYIY